MVFVILIVLGLCFGSFINALVWRIHEQGIGQRTKGRVKDLSILKGRSMCPHCRHELAAKDLIPLVSWVILRGRCRYCKKAISVQYPIVEAATAAVFVISYIYWPMQLTGGGQWTLFITWLAVSVGLIALVAYDARWMILPNKILYPAFFVAIAGRLTYIIFFAPHKIHDLELLVLSLLVACGIFWLLYQLSKGRWIGFGDVRLGLVTGTVLGRPSLSILMIFLAAILGTIATLPDLLTGRKTFTSKLAFGPFLVTATAITLLFGPNILSWYRSLAGL